MGRDIAFQDQGVAEFFEAKANGRNKIGLRAPATVAADIDIELLAVLPGVTEALTIDATGQMGTTSISAGDLNDAYNSPTPGAGRVITADNGAVEVNVPGGGGNVGLLVTNADNFDVLQVTKSAIGVGVGILVTNAGTGIGVEVIQNGVAIAASVRQNAAAIGVSVDQDGDGVALNVDIAAASTSTGLNILNAGTGVGLLVTQNGVMDAAQFIQSQNDNGVFIQKTGAGAGDALLVQNLGTGIGISIDQDGDGRALDIDAAATSTVDAVRIVNEGTGAALFIDQNGVGRSLVIDAIAPANVVEITKFGSFAGDVILITNGGTGPGIRITQTGTADALVVNQSGFGSAAVFVDQDSNAIGISVDVIVTSSSAGIQVLHAGTGNGLFLDQDGNGIALNIDSEATSQPLINLSPLSTNSRGDIAFSALRGADPASPAEGDVWYQPGIEDLRLRTDGLTAILGGRFNVRMGGRESVTIATGVATISQSMVRLNAESGTSDDVDTITDVPSVGEFALLLLTADTGDTITLKTGTGNLRLGGDIVLDTIHDNALLVKIVGNWVEVSRSTGNPA